MIYASYFHEVVSMGNKMLVIGGSGFEAFDSFSRKFTLIKRIPSLSSKLESNFVILSDSYILCKNNIVINVGYKLKIYTSGESEIYSYDIFDEEWHKENKKLDEVQDIFNYPIKVPTT